MITIELFGFKAEKFKTEYEINQFFSTFDPNINVLFIVYDIVPTNKDGENTKVVKLIASSRLEVRKLRRSNFLELDCFKDANLGFFHYYIVKQAGERAE